MKANGFLYKGGAEFYLIEQEGYKLPELETSAACLANFRKLRSKKS